MSNKKSKCIFEKIIQKVFGMEFYDTNDFQKRYKAILNFDDSTTNQYGGSDSCIELMIFVRNRMRCMGLAPNCSMPVIDEKFDFSQLMFLMEETKFSSQFPMTFEKEKEKLEKCNELRYLVDGWDYSNFKGNLEDNEWVGMNGKLYTHFYYNELDHLLTHLVGNIHMNKGVSFIINENNSADWVLTVMRDEILNN